MQQKESAPWACRREHVCKRSDGPSRASGTIVTLNLIQGLYKLWLNILQIPNQVRDDGLDGGSSLGRCFFCNKKNPSPEPVEGGLFAKRCRHFDRLSDRVAADEFVCKEASAFESPLDAALRVQGPRCGARNVSCKGMPPHIRHPELVSGSVEVVAEYFTDAESSSA